MKMFMVANRVPVAEGYREMHEVIISAEQA